MYEIYETESFILNSYDKIENDKRVLIFSKDFGLIWIDVGAARRENSKLKPVIQPFSYSKIFLVRGKNGYRMTGGFLIDNIFFDIKKERKKKIIKLKNFLNLIEKLLIKNHQDIEIWNLNSDLWDKIKEKDIKLDEIEILYTLRLLLLSGYFSIEFLRELNIDVNNDILNLDNIKKKKIIFEINKQLQKNVF